MLCWYETGTFDSGLYGKVGLMRGLFKQELRKSNTYVYSGREYRIVQRKEKSHEEQVCGSSNYAQCLSKRDELVKYPARVAGRRCYFLFMRRLSFCCLRFCREDRDCLPCLARPKVPTVGTPCSQRRSRRAISMDTPAYVGTYACGGFVCDDLHGREIAGDLLLASNRRQVSRHI